MKSILVPIVSPNNIYMEEFMISEVRILFSQNLEGLPPNNVTIYHDPPSVGRGHV